jgi:dihydrolipoamide dehydrogenase
VLSEELELQMSSDISSANEGGDGVEICWRTAQGAQRSRSFEAVLVAAGRPPNLESLNLSATGLPLDDRSQPPWNPQTGQCGDLPIFLAGDANGHRPLLHEASDEGSISGANAARWPEVTRQDRRAGLTVVFSDPQIAVVGTPYGELDDSISIGQVDFANQGRARIMAVNRGIMRLYAHHPGCVLVGAEMFGPRMEHTAHLLAWAIQERTTVQHLLQMPVYHPTLEEGMRTALRSLARALKVEGNCRSVDMTIAPGT